MALTFVLIIFLCLESFSPPHSILEVSGVLYLIRCCHPIFVTSFSYGLGVGVSRFPFEVMSTFTKDNFLFSSLPPLPVKHFPVICMLFPKQQSTQICGLHCLICSPLSDSHGSWPSNALAKGKVDALSDTKIAKNRGILLKNKKIYQF